jgi:hypothetical protein
LRISLSDLRKADLRGASLEGAILGRTDLRGANLLASDLRGAILVLTELQGTNLNFADLRGAIVADADLQGASLREARLQGSQLAGADLRGTDLQRADLRGADLSGNSWAGCTNLQGADLRKADLRAADLAGADLRGADLRNAHLWRMTIGDEPDRDDFWNLADVRGADVDPVDLGRLITETEDQIANARTRGLVVERLESALRDDERPDLPSWQAQPTVMFLPDDPIADALDWSAPSMSDEDYDEKLAIFLVELACGDAGPALTRGLASRASREEDRLFSQRLAQRLTLDDPKVCPPAAELPEDWRPRLERLAARLEQPQSELAEPRPAPPDTPSQERQPSVPNE